MLLKKIGHKGKIRLRSGLFERDEYEFGLFDKEGKLKKITRGYL